MESPTANSFLTLHGWPSKHLHGVRLPWLLLALPMMCAFFSPLLQRAMSTFLAIRLPYLVAFTIILVVWLPLFWRGRWPIVPRNSLPTWQLDLSPKGFAARRYEGQADWRPWTPVMRVSFRRVRPDFCRVRILEEIPSRPFDPEVVDLVVACDDQMVEQVTAHVRACREGCEVDAPIVESSSMAARSVAKQSRSSAAVGQDGAFGMEQCPYCGYDLAGLPAKGQCPECGFEYDAEALIALFGRNASMPGYMPASVYVRSVGIFIPTMILIGLGSDWLAPLLGIPGEVGSLAMISPLLAIFWLQERRGRDPQHPRGVPFFANTMHRDGQLRLSPTGVGVRLGYGACLMRPWSDRMHVRIDRLEGGTYRLQISNSPEKVRFHTYVWARLDFDSDDQTVKRILERVVQWRQPAMTASADARGPRRQRLPREG